MREYHAIVVGAGPAGATAALRMAQLGLNVLILERGISAGSKNMFGGLLPNCPLLEELIPGFWDKAPWERHAIRRTMNIVGEATVTSFTFESENFDKPPYNGYTLFRPIFDRWYADQAKNAGATLITGCTVDELIIEKGRVAGIRTGKEEFRAPAVVLCDGVLSLLSTKIGISRPPSPLDMALGIKALFRLSEPLINERFNLVRQQGVTQEFLGCTEGIRGGGFIYTQTETISAGLVVHLASLKERGIPPYELLEGFLKHHFVRRMLKGARLVEYSAHLIPEGGYNGVKRLFADGLLIAGDAAGLCYTNGLNQEGMNLAIASGFMAAETVQEALNAGDCSKKMFASYEERLKKSFVLKDMKTFYDITKFMHNDRLFSLYPAMIGRIIEELYQSNGRPRKAFGRVAWDVARDMIPLRHLVPDLIKGGKTLI